MDSVNSSKETSIISSKVAVYKDIRFQVGFLLMIVVALISGWYWMNDGIQTTDNATIECDVIDVTSEVRGVIAEINFDDDQLVEKNQTLAKIDDRFYAANLRRSEAELEISRFNLRSAQERHSLVELNSRSEFEQSKDSLQGVQARKKAIENEITELGSSIDIAEINLAREQQKYERTKTLNSKGLVSKSEFDNALFELESSKARLAGVQAKLKAKHAELETTRSSIAELSKRSRLFGESEAKLINQEQAEVHIAQAQTHVAQAQRDLAALDMERTQIKALSPGFIADRNVGVGQLVEIGQPIARIVSCSEKAWIEANFKETQIGNMTSGLRAEISIDAYPGKVFQGKVESISSGSGSTFSLLPPENATGNFTKVVKRIPVKVVPLEKPEEIMRAGMSAIVAVYEN
tara:strand:- start:20967 stop:22184 length:1218 start_codon:yes stop_codon:yes gene_type:complete